MSDGVEKCLLQMHLNYGVQRGQKFIHASIIQATTLVWSKACLIISKPPVIMIIVSILAIVLTTYLVHKSHFVD